MNFKTRRESTVGPKSILPVMLFAACVLTSCGTTNQNVELAKENVGVFHAQLDTEQYNAIYAAADDKFHSATTEAEFAKLLQAIHSKLGTVRQANLRNKGVAWYTGQGATVTLVYDTKFSDGAAAEQFVWHIKDNQATLYSYRINSNDLITK